MANHGKRITSKSAAKTPAQRKKALAKRDSDYFADSEYSLGFCMSNFMVAQIQKGNSKATIDYYKRFRKKFDTFLLEWYKCSEEEAPVEMLMDELTQTLFMTSKQYAASLGTDTSKLVRQLVLELINKKEK